ncbi:MAG: CAAX prenyl protease-related protein [Bryobacteraceae bacterium]
MRRYVSKHPAVPYVAPFATFILLLGVEGYLPFGPEVAYPVRFGVVAVVMWLFSRNVITWRAPQMAGSIAVGVAVFVIWVGPDVVWPQYREHWLFQNPIFGRLKADAPASLKSNVVFLIFRSLGCFALVPMLEEIFWRGWLARWLIDGVDFERIPLGAYTAASFWIGSALFAAEHGPYWEVGLLAGILYNWWMIRTKNLANCIVAHAVTNALLTAYVLVGDKWRYWL